MDLVRDLLDKAVVDRNGREMGRVDGLLLDVTDDRPPRVTAIEIGPAVLAHRLHPALGRLAALVEELLGVAQERPVRIPLSEIKEVSSEITADVAIGATGAGNVEQLVRRLMRGWRWR